MGGWSRICCAIDASEPSRAALEHAIDLARRHAGALLHVIHVRRPAPPTNNPFAPPPRQPSEGADEVARMSDWLARAREALPGHVESVERSGDAAAEIVAYAAEWDADVIVLGSHARRGFQRLLLGSMAEAVLRDAKRPVLVVPASAPGSEPRDDRAPGRILG